ncbi:MAG TPA: DEAD/DEAH box helicase, partial [Bacteroidia bacterium]|nr:DEAD/DEAH box helicase [Bacteroidia bacterium]
MQIETADKIFSRLQEGEKSSQFIAQANARYLLFGVNEPLANFPNFKANLTTGSNTLGLTYLSLGCCYAENGRLEKASESFQIGASILEFNHYPKANRTVQSPYYLLICSLAYYSARQYSKSFVILKESEYETRIGKITSLFLKRNLNRLTEELNGILLEEKDGRAANDEKAIESEIHLKLYSIGISNLIEFIYSGSKLALEKSKEVLTDLLDLLQIENEPSMWWIVRLILLINDGFKHNSVWSTIKPKFTELGLNADKNLNESNPDDPFDFPEIDPLLSNDIQLDKYINGLLFRDKPVIELFVSQIDALDAILDKSGAVVSLPTSSGKTRIAE